MRNLLSGAAPNGPSAAMRLSVVVPAYNACRTIEHCVNALLQQTRLPDAIYTVDNGSTDGTYEWLLNRARHEPRLHVMREPRRGSGIARNAALRLIPDGIVAFTDADCVPEAQWLAGLAEEHVRWNAAAVAGAIVGYQDRTPVERYMSITAFPVPPRTCIVRRCTPSFAYAFYTGNLSVAADVLRRLGGFDEAIQVSTDADLCLRILRSGEGIVLAPHVRVAHFHHSNLRAMLKRLFEYGAARPMIIRKHHPGTICIFIARRAVVIRGPITLQINLTSPEKVSLALIVLSMLSPWCFGLLGLYWMRLALLMKHTARRRGIAVRSTRELAILTALHLLEFGAMNMGSLITSPRNRTLCV